jgi:hypothetical protein
MTDTWKERLGAIGQSLLTLEINTVATTGLSAQKMPEVPLALHTLVLTYADYLATAGFQVTLGLLRSAANRVDGKGGASTNEGARLLLRELQSWPFPGRMLTVAEQRAGLKAPGTDHVDATGLAEELTNGAETFEALQWAAWAALQTSRAGGTVPGNPDAAVVSRVNANCRQLKEAARRLEQQYVSRTGRKSMPGPRTRAPDAATAPRLFGATVEETARALFQHPRPVFLVDPDIAILIRKAWDLGVERVCLQTVMQVDGDLLQAIGDIGGNEREFLTQLHKSAVKDGVEQWHSLFDVVRQLAGAVGSAVFGA